MRLGAARLAFLISASLAAQVPPADRAEAWREDLAFFAREFPARQKDFAKLYPQAKFDAALKDLSTNLEASTDADVVLGLMRLVAGAHVGHTYVRMPTDGPLAFRSLPIGVQWFSDGLAVTAATEPYRDAMGLRITAIGRLSPEQLQAAVAPFISYEHEAWLHLQSQTIMLAEEVLRTLELIDADGQVTLTLARPNGSTMTTRMPPIRWAERRQMSFRLNYTPNPALADPTRYYRYEILPGTKTLYLRYSKCADDPLQPFAAFAQELFAKVDADPKAVDRVVVDLRDNGGGDSRVIKPLLDGLHARKALSARGHLFALIGPATFSSALMAALELKNLKAILVGEAPGEQLNSYGEVRPLTLPRSKLFIQYSTKYFKLGGGKTLEPDIVVKKSIAEWLAGEDPVLARAMGR